MSRKYEQRRNVATVLLLLSLLCVGISYLQYEEPLVPLYPIKLGERDNTEISEALTRLKIEHELDPDIGIMLRRDDKTEAQSKLASMNLPRRSFGPPSPTPRQETELEKALSKRLLEMPTIEDVKVTVSIQTKSYFPNDPPRSIARVYVKLTDGATLTDADLLEIKQLFHSAVPVIEWGNVRIMDSTGRQLSPRKPK